MPSTSRPDLLELASRLARESAKLIHPAGGTIIASRKSDDTVVTAADTAIQAYIVRSIADAFPDHAVCAEETLAPAADAPDPGRARFCWVIDPLDGTRNYVSGLPCFATSLAVLEQGRPIAAVTYEHNQQLLFTASIGEGAKLNGTPIHVEEPPRHHDQLLGIPSTKDAPTLAVTRSWLGSKGFICRNLGASTVHLGLVAAGVLSGAFARQAKLWDVAAGVLLVTESGGLVTDPSGSELLPFRLDGDWRLDIPFLAAGPSLHMRLLESIRKPAN